MLEPKTVKITSCQILILFHSVSPRQCGRYGSSSNSSAPSGGQEGEQPQGLGHSEDVAEHEHMKAVLRTSLSSSDKEASGVPGLRTRTRSRPGRGGEGDRKFLRGSHREVNSKTRVTAFLNDIFVHA